VYRFAKIFIPAVLLAVFGAVQYFGLQPGLDKFIHDNLLVTARPASDNIIIVGIDERSINEIGTWPWPRYFVAEAVLQLTEFGAAAIGVNVLYDTVTPYDEYLLRAAEGTDRLVLGGMGVISPFTDGRGLLEIDYFLLPFYELAAVSSVGFLNALPDSHDGIMRRALTSMRFGDITVHSFPYEVYRVYSQGAAEVPLDAHGQFPIRYVGGPGSFTAVSLWGVINGEYPAAMFRDAVVLIGPYAPGIGEAGFHTPFERAAVTHGVEVYANIIQNFIEGVFVTDAPWWVSMVLLAFLGFVVILLFRYAKPVVGLVVTLVIIFGILFAARLTYNHLHIIVLVGNAVIFLGLSYVANLALGIFSAQSEKQHIKELFGRFVAPEVVNEIISGGVEIQLGGVVKEITALFVDIRGFTAFSESNPPEKVVEMINRYLALTSTAIQHNNGTIDKYMGDATMALFNAPNDVPGHALCAVRAAWAMRGGSLSLRGEILEKYGVDLQFGIGINTGTAVVGNMGSDFRMDYTAIGDAINTAARLESNAEKGQIIISEATYEQVKDYVEVKDLGVIHVKNKKTGIQVYSIEGVQA